MLFVQQGVPVLGTHCPWNHLLQTNPIKSFLASPKDGECVAGLRWDVRLCGSVILGLKIPFPSPFLICHFMADPFCAQQEELISSLHMYHSYIFPLGLATVIIPGSAAKEHETAHASAWVHTTALWEPLIQMISMVASVLQVGDAHTDSALGMNEDCFPLENRNVLRMKLQGILDWSTC